MIVCRITNPEFIARVPGQGFEPGISDCKSDTLTTTLLGSTKVFSAASHNTVPLGRCRQGARLFTTNGVYYPRATRKSLLCLRLQGCLEWLV